MMAGGAEGVAVSNNGKTKGITSRGKRENNEDGFLVAETAIAVGDGMGGHVGGAIASRTALRLTGEYIENGLFHLKQLFEAVCSDIAIIQQQHKHLEGMGTTLAMVRKTPISKTMASYEMAHVGDVKIIAFSKKHRTMVYDSLDQSVVQNQIDRKILKPIERYTSDKNSIITNSVSAKGLSKEPGYHKTEWEDGDLVVVACSDGIADYVSMEEAMELYFKLYDEDPKTASARYPEELHNLAISRQRRPEGFDIKIKNKLTNQLETHHIVITGDGGDNATAAVLE